MRSPLIIFITIFFTFFLVSCAKEKKVSVLSEGDLDEQMINLFEEAYDAFLNWCRLPWNSTTWYFPTSTSREDFYYKCNSLWTALLFINIIIGKRIAIYALHVKTEVHLTFFCTRSSLSLSLLFHSSANACMVCSSFCFSWRTKQEPEPQSRISPRYKVQQ